ncbi:MAG TPA: MBL fold metallo-hydrolase [Pirellulales bacterium]|jgi:phosphoribosyl 1,2-cyclic phosphate phosphodiesterase|nr:MBL fold metallo-hydrolase [Pirellulales bacterium]
MALQLQTIDIRGRLIFLGTGTSVGVPCVGCGCSTCTSGNAKNQRTRCSLLLGLPEGNLLIDTTPDLRSQLLREKVGIVHAVLYTHEHADHVFGLDDVRLFPHYLGHALPVYCEDFVEARIRKSFDYAFTEDNHGCGGGVPQLDIRRINLKPFTLLGQPIIPIRLWHGKFQVLGFRIGNIAYCTDTNGIPPESLAQLAGLDVLILDALRQRPHVSHYSLDQAIAVAKQLRPQRTFFTHMCHDLEHEATNAALPAGMELAYDGLQLQLS